MKIRLFLVFLLLATAAQAGPVELESKEMAPKITDNDPWYFNLGSPGWLAAVSGDIGLHGITSNVGVDFDQIIQHTDFLMSLSAEVRKGRFGAYADFLYLSLSDAVYPRELITQAVVNLDEYLVDGEVYYRIIECPQGRLDLRAGGRYLNVYNTLQLQANAGQIDRAATDLTNALPGDVHGLLRRQLLVVLDNHDPSSPSAPLGFREKGRLERRILAAKQNPNPGLVHQKISTVLQNSLNQTFRLTEYWTDPYIGVGGRYNLTKAFYVTGKVDVGGFGIGSDVSVQASAAVGCQITRHMYSEIGYRYLYEDYESNDYLFRTSTYGVQITSGFQF